MPAATAAAATIQVGSNSVAVKPQFKYVGSIVQADGGQDRELLAFVVGGLGFEFCVFVAGWRLALRSEWPFIIIIISVQNFQNNTGYSRCYVLNI